MAGAKQAMPNHLRHNPPSFERKQNGDLEMTHMYEDRASEKHRAGGGAASTHQEQGKPGARPEGDGVEEANEWEENYRFKSMENFDEMNTSLDQARTDFDSVQEKVTEELQRMQEEHGIFEGQDMAFDVDDFNVDPEEEDRKRAGGLGDGPLFGTTSDLVGAFDD